MLDVRGTRIRVLRGGSGAPLIFLHGASGHVGWLPFLERLSQRFDVIAPEHPGFGASDDPPWLDRPSDLAYFYLDLIAALKLDRVHLMGTSLGGWIAAELAVRNTSRLASLTLVCAVGILANDGAPMDDMFRMSAEENARRFYFDPDRVRRRLEGLRVSRSAHAGAQPQHGRAPLVSALRQSGARRSGCIAWTCRRCWSGARMTASFRRGSARPIGTASRARRWS